MAGVLVGDAFELFLLGYLPADSLGLSLVESSLDKFGTSKSITGPNAAKMLTQLSK